MNDDYNENLENKENLVDEEPNQNNIYKSNEQDTPYSNQDIYSSSTTYKQQDKQQDYVDANKKKPMGKKTKALFISICAVLCIGILSLSGYGLYTLVNPIFKNNSSSHTSPKETANANAPTIDIQSYNSDTNALSAEQVYQNASNSIVGVVVYSTTDLLISDPVGQGSGIVISEDGYILTNSHVIGDSKNYKISIVTLDETEYSATVVGFDTRTDLAVVKADAKGLTPATFGNSDELNVGQSVIAIGNPGGLDFASSLTRGVVSALNRSLGSQQSLVKYIQTDAAINPGNSGGALLNMYGQVVGINTSKIAITGYEGMGFAIPINTAKTIVDDIIAQGYVSGRVRLGISGKEVTAYQASMYNVPQGVIIAEISKDSDMASKGVSVGDIITKIDGTVVTGFDKLYSQLSTHNVGDSVTLTIYRPGLNSSRSTTFEANITLLEDKGETQVTSSSNN